MPYTAVIDRPNPTAFMFLIDQSRSTNEKMDGGETKAKFVGDVLNKTLFQLVTRCASADGVRDYFDIGVLAYSGNGVYSGFAGALSASSLHPISSLAARPLRVEERQQRVPDGTGGLVDQSVKFPVWINSVSVGDTLMCEGFRKAAERLVGWCNSHAKSHPPTIIHVTGGPSTDGNPEQIAEAIRHISTNHGQCLLFNLHIGTSETASLIFPTSEAGLPDAHSKMLFRMSSLFPAHLIKPARDKGYSVSPESRFFGYKAGYESLVNFFDICTRVSDLLLKESTSPKSGQTSARPIKSGTTNKSHQLKARPAEAPSPQPAEAAKAPSAEPSTGATQRRRRPAWLQGVRMVGLAAAVVAAIVVFKLFGIGSGLQPPQFSNQTSIIPAKDDPASTREPKNNGQSTRSSGGQALPTAESSSDRTSVPLPDVTKVAAPADPGTKLTAGAEQTTEPAHVPVPIQPPKNSDQPKVAETSTGNPSSAEVEASAANPPSDAVNPDLAKVPDARRVQQRLIELGYLYGVSDGVWGPSSKRALSDFRTAEKLGQDEPWDQATEKKLFSTSTARKQQSLAFVGGWSKDASSCADVPIKITASRAISRDATCGLRSIRQEAEGRWRVQAHCELDSSLRTEDTENSWTSNIKLTLDNRRLTWESEKGVENYYRCSQ
jgi:hypothetical protein